MTTATRSDENQPGDAVGLEYAEAGSERLPRRTVLWYGIGQAAEGIKNHSFTAFLLFYYTSVLGLTGTLAGAALMIALVFDAVTDPLVAVLSDRTRSRWGRRHPYMFLSAIPLGGFFWLTFAPPAGLGDWLGIDPQLALFGWLVSFSILTRAAMTLFHVPHMALGAELTDDFDERTRVVTARSILAVVGTTVCVIGYFGLLALYGSADYSDPRLNPAPYAVFAAIFGVVIMVVVLLSAWNTRDRIPMLHPPDEKSQEMGVVGSLLRDTREAIGLRSFRALFLGFTVCFLGFGVTNALNAHNALYFWHISLEIQGLLGLALGLGIMLGMGFWKKFAERNDKKPTFIGGLILFTLFAAPPPLLKAMGFYPAEDSFLYLPLLFLINFFLAFGISSLMVVTGSMMADITDLDELVHNRRREGIFFGSLSFASKAASGLGTVIAGVAYDWVGLYKGLDPADASDDMAVKLGLITGGVILVLVGLSAAIFSRYDLTRERHADIQRQLESRSTSRS
jgi:Na+/melibiose symporter-like transporter